MNLIEHYLALNESAGGIPSFDEVWACADFDDLEQVNEFWDLDAHAEEYEDLFDESPDDDYDAFLSWALHNPEKENRRAYFNEIVNEYQDGRTCYRSIRISPDIDPKAVNPIGVYWSLEHKGAESYWAENDGVDVIFKAVIDKQNIDWLGTLCARMTPHFGGEEEVRFIEGREIFVTSIQLGNEHIEINDWRRC